MNPDEIFSWKPRKEKQKHKKQVKQINNDMKVCVSIKR